MLSRQAGTAVDQLFAHSLQSALIAGPEDVCEVSPVAPAQTAGGSRVVVLTSSSYVLRVFSFIYFEPDAATRAHLARRSRIPEADMTESQFADALCEVANMCCGTLNRALGSFFAHIGLSTPNILDRRSADRMQVLGADHTQHFRVAINGVALFYAGIAVCSYADLDFSLPPAAMQSTQEVSSGELELF